MTYETVAPFATPSGRPLWLASRSPRRRRMLDAFAGDVIPRTADIDDGLLDPGQTSAACWVAALAYLKARRVADDVVAGEETGCVLGADTVCVVDGRVIGQPADASEARAMLSGMRNRVHQVMTGVAVVDPERGARWMFVDCADVTWGAIDDATIEAYVDSGEWRGKAGAYNLEDRIESGWPITCSGDPDTVMGLPMRRLLPWLEES